MIPFRRKRRVDPDTKRGISQALHEAYDSEIDAKHDEDMMRLIERMREFEENGGAK